MNEKFSISALPAKMKALRAISANTIPNSSTFCWSLRGTAKLPMITRNTKRLSTLSAFSVMYPAKYSEPICGPPKMSTTTPKITARAT